MEIKRYSKREIALQQIETALSLFLEGRDLFSVVTLAASAEEILVELLNRRKAGGVFRSVLEMLRPAARTKDAATSFAAGEDEDYIHMDLRQEALFLLGRAIQEYRTLTGSLTPTMLRFDAQYGNE